MQRYRIEVGRDHGVQTGNIVGAISNEAQLEGRYIGHVRIFDSFSLVDLPEGMPGDTFRHMEAVRVCGQELRIRPDTGLAETDRKAGKPAKAFKKKLRHKKLRNKKKAAKKRGKKPRRET